MSRHATARLFVAVDLPDDVREQLASWARLALRAAGGRPGAGHPLRVLDADLLHVTLCFLGNLPVEEIEPVGAQLAGVVEGGCELSVGAPLWLPRRHPRVLAVELHDDNGELARLQRRLLSALHEICDFGEDEHAASARQRRFHPHVTVARMRAGAAPRERKLEPTPALTFSPSELVLYRSWLSPSGASYEALASAPLA
jgi:RNA 2',3'-cyclic 3'-phosphodiesterase